MKLAVNAVGMAPGGGLTYLQSQSLALVRARPAWDIRFYVNARCAEALRTTIGADRVVQVPHASHRLARRIWDEQVWLPRELRRGAPDVLYDIGGFVSFRAHVPQVVFNQNPNHHAGLAELGLSAVWALTRVQKLAARLSARRAAAVIYPTQAYAKAMTAAGFDRPDAVVATAPPTDLADLELADGPVIDGPFALAVHHWYAHKRLEWLIDTWRSRPDLRDLRLVLVGGPMYAAPARRIRAALARIEGADNVTSLTELPRADVARLYRDASVYVSSAILEAFPQTPFEAMEFGIPCVLSDIPSHREVAGDAAVYFPPGDGAALAEAIGQAGSRREELADAGARRVAGFSWERNAEDLARVIERVVDGAS